MEGVKLNGTFVGARKTLNFIEGSGIDITIDGQDDAGSNEVDITIVAGASGDLYVGGDLYIANTGGAGYSRIDGYAGALYLVPATGAIHLTNNNATVLVSTMADGLTFGSAADTNLYRSAANTLKTDDDFDVAGSGHISSGGSFRGNYLEAYSSSGTYIDMASSTSMTFTARTATTNIVMAVKGMAAQTGNLQEWRNSSDAILASINASGNFRQLVGAVGATGTTETIAIANGDVQTFTVDGDCVFTMPTGLTSGQAYSLTCILTDSGGPNDITFTGVKWSGGNNPTIMSAASAVDIFTFTTIDGGTTWYGFIAGQGMAT